MVTNIIVGFVCLSIGAVLGFIFAAMLSSNKDY